MNTNRNTIKIVALSAAALCTVGLSACSSSKSGGSSGPTGSANTSAQTSTPATNTPANSPANGAGTTTAAASGGSNLTSDPCGALSIAQVSAVTGGTVTATPTPAVTGGTFGCTYKAASLNEIDTAFATLAISPPCAANGSGTVVVNGVGKCAVYTAETHLLVVFGSTYSATINSAGFAATQAQLTQLGQDLASRL